MAEYEQFRKGKLILKGEKKNSAKSRKRKSKNKKSETKGRITQTDEDAITHGGWWKITNISDICGPIAIEIGKNSYIKALDNGLFTLGDPHKEQAGPDPEEILTSFQINTDNIAFKSGYGKYLRAEENGTVTGRSEAVGDMEQWKPIFQDDKTGLLANNGKFMTINPENGTLTLRNKIEDTETLIIRTSVLKDESEHDKISPEETGDLSMVEQNYIKKFQKFQDKKPRIQKDNIKELQLAKVEGNLHETLLDRRSKTKADRYCK